MKRSSLFNRTLWVAGLAVGLSGVLQAQYAPVPPKEKPGEKPDVQIPGEKSELPAARHGMAAQPKEINKATGLIGLQVANPQGKQLGKIRDLVIDLNSGRVSYCVMGMDGGLFSNEKFLAVPLRAFQPSPDSKSLILRVDQEKLAQAKGLDPDHWPSVTNPAWGAQPFWKENPPPSEYLPPRQNQGPEPSEPATPGESQPKPQPADPGRG